MATDGMWQLDFASTEPGWLEVPVFHSDVDDWVIGATDELRDGWAERWIPVYEDIVPQLLRLALAERPVGAVRSFQVWPLPGPFVGYVDICGGTRPEGFRMRPGNGRVYRSEGLGMGLQTVQSHSGDEGDTVGISVLFDVGENLVEATLRPTVPRFLPFLASGFEGLLQSMVLTNPQGDRVHAQLPDDFPEIRADADWADTVPTR